MAITASSFKKNRIFREDGRRTVFESAYPVLSSAVTYNQGDLMCFDTSSKVIRRVAATTDAVTFVGIADNSVSSGKLAGPYDGLTAVDASQAIQDLAGPAYSVEAKVILKAGDAFNPGDKVYLADGQDSQTVSVTDPSDHNYIGYYTGVAVASAASGQEGVVMLGARFPAATGSELRF